MQVVETIKELRSVIKSARARGATVAFVPTMGGLHEGHLKLVKRARQLAGADGLVVTSIFVNPTQFGKGEDLGAYPRDFAGDAALLKEAEVDMIFHPSVLEIYPEGFASSVDIGLDNCEEPRSSIVNKLCGASRPGHFSGVATIVTKLFNIVTPEVAVFGQKDYQQQLVIKKLVKDLDMDILVDIVPTVREQDGLAMSSRNGYLDDDARGVALCVPKALELACELFAAGGRSAEEIKEEMRTLIEAHNGAAVDYISICEPETLEEARELREGLLVAVAVRIVLFAGLAAMEVVGSSAGTATAESVRLIDNCILDGKHVNITG